MFRALFTQLMREYFKRRPTIKNRLFARDRLRKWCIDSELVVSTRHGFKMAVSPNDYASYGIYFFGEYDPSMTSFVIKYISRGAVCWDVGTERGWFTLLLANLVGPSGRVDAFEAYGPNYEKLVKNIDLNGYRHVHPFNFAVSDCQGPLHFVPPSDDVTHNIGFLQNCGGVGYVTETAGKNTHTVQAVRLDAHVAGHPLSRLDFIKIDIEGEELRALRGAEQTIRNFRPILSIEYNRETAARAGSSVEELDLYLDHLGYDRFSVSGSDPESLKLIPLSDLAAIPEVHNVYCFPR